MDLLYRKCMCRESGKSVMHTN